MFLWLRVTVFFRLLLKLIVMQLGLRGAFQMMLCRPGVVLQLMMVLAGPRLLCVMMLRGACIVGRRAAGVKAGTAK